MLDYDFKIRIMCLLLLSFVGKSVAGVCPPPGEISPCICGDLGSEGLVSNLVVKVQTWMIQERAKFSKRCCMSYIV